MILNIRYHEKSSNKLCVCESVDGGSLSKILYRKPKKNNIEGLISNEFRHMQIKLTKRCGTGENGNWTQKMNVILKHVKK